MGLDSLKVVKPKPVARAGMGEVWNQELLRITFELAAGAFGNEPIQVYDPKGEWSDSFSSTKFNL